MRRTVEVQLADLANGRVLVVEDDEELRSILVAYLRRAGFSVEAVADGFAALEAATLSPPDVVLLDRMIPGVDGVEICRRLRTTSNAPILLLTAMGQPHERIDGLEAGADDYVVKPVAPREIVLRVIRLLQRTAHQGAGESPITLGRFRLTPAMRVIQSDGVDLELTVREFELFAFLLRHPDRVHSREEIAGGAWGWEAGDTSAVAVNIRRLRLKVESDASRPVVIRSVWGHGYLLDSEATR
ncbi:response regulator transcription factor [Microbacterium sp. K27]|uniref:response regulator transcription factor n=1 Tax=Microbacterium sp. K27 TaxID=2305445 RepID=UPI001F0EA3C4|nr:response regulator transcription factor [Microbacterium sp. K27]